MRTYTLAEVMHALKTDHLRFSKIMREQAPILAVDDCVFLFKDVDVQEVLTKPEVFSVALYKPKMSKFLMAFDNDPVYSQEKQIMQQILKPEDLPRIQVLVQQEAKKILTNRNSHSIDLVHDYAKIIPTQVARTIFGLYLPSKQMMRWSYWNQYNTFHNQPFDLYSNEKKLYIEDQHNSGSRQLVVCLGFLMVIQYIKVKLLTSKTVVVKALRSSVNFLLRTLWGKPPLQLQDTSLERMLAHSYAAPNTLSFVRTAVNAGGLLIGTVETTAQAVTQILAAISKQPSVLRQARKYAKSDDDKFAKLVFEVFRFVPISSYMFRQAEKTYTIAAGTDRAYTVHKGQYVLAVIGSAMFDEAIYENADKLNPQRDNSQNYHFGFGSHTCLGKHIGEVLVVEMVRAVLLHADLHRPLTVDYQNGPFPEECVLSLKA